MRCIAFAFALLLSLSGEAEALDYQLIDLDEVTEKFETSMKVVQDRIAAEQPPKYLLYQVDVTYSLTNGLDGNAGGKIPVGVVGVELSGKYSEVKTTEVTYTYKPRVAVPTNFNDKGVLAFLNRMQKRAKEDGTKTDFKIAKTEYLDEFVMEIDGTGKLTFLGVAEISATAQVKNSHRVKFYFCLMTTAGSCKDG